MKRSVIAKRIKEARERCGLNQKELANLMGWKSHSSITAIEKGEQDIKTWELLKFAQVLKVSPESLYSKESQEMPKHPVIFWRQKAADPALVQQEERNIVQHCEDYRLLERLVAPTPSQRRELPKKLFNIDQVDFDWANRLADEMHRELNLGDYPAEVLARRLEEDFGVVLLCRSLDNGSAACLRSGDDIVIVMNENEIPWRQVFSLAHELFHIITWNSSLIEKIQDSDSLFSKNEKLANAFAAALLIPQQMIELDLYGQKLTYSLVVALARKYGVSASTMLWRLSHLRFLSAEAVKAALEDKDFVQLDKSSFKKAFESVRSFGNRFLRLAYLAFERGRLSKSRFARMLGVNLRELDNYLSTKGFELTNDKEIIASIG
ncbi:MAG: hypothetical protein K940chlam7_01870 [Chlamydiae bacterium]|nr:hypothetical protein [Chlamydiota bacterium]